MSLTIKNIAKITSGKFVQRKSPEKRIRHLLIDSRQVVFPAESIFFSLSGNRQDGHAFIEEVYEKGVRAFIISKKVKTKKLPDANFIKVEDTREALQKIATFHRKQFELPVIGITGSNGKTIIKEWLYQMLSSERKIVRSPKSFNSQIGVPLSVWQMDEEDELAIFEAGISQPKEMKNLAPIIRCDWGIFTNIGTAHSEGFKNETQKINEKLKLFKFAKKIFYCENHTHLAKAIEKKYAKRELISWSFDQMNGAALSLKKVDSKNKQTFFKGTFREKKVQLEIPFADKANIENALHCCLIMFEMGYSNQVIQKRIWQLKPMAMRLEMKAAIDNCLLISDYYNNDLTALRIALDFMEQQSDGRQRTIILSDILQSGLSTEKLYKTVAQLLAEKQINRVIGIGQEISQLKKSLSKKVASKFFKTTESFLKKINPHLKESSWFQNEIILLKGARNFQFERIANRLSQKAHRTVLEINLNALKHNLNAFAARLQPEVKLLVMVKASGYGSGSVEVARLLQFQKVDYLAVAYADEGVELRQAGIDLPILVLNPEEVTFDLLLRYNLEPEVYDLQQLERLITSLPSGKKIAIHLKLDTGMNRLGFSEKEIKALCKQLKNEPKVEVKSMFSHLAASEAKAHDDFSKEQFGRFENMADDISKELAHRPMRHILNSAGIARFPNYQLDMVRLGIGIYGIDSSGELHDELQNVLTLKATISQIKTVEKGATIGYGRKGKATKKMRVGTISVGYADGLLRAAGNGNFSVSVRGMLAPTIGNICMDMSMIDLTHIPEATEGDEVIIFGESPSVDDLAKAYGTIVYEVFTNISERVKRVYFEE